MFFYGFSRVFPEKTCFHIFTQLKNVIPESSITVSDNMRLTWSFIETKSDWWMSVQTVWPCLVQRRRAIQTPRAVWINAVQHSNHRPEKMKMDDLTMKNIPRSKVTHIGSHAASDSLKNIIHCARLNTNIIQCVPHVGESLSLTDQ